MDSRFRIWLRNFRRKHIEVISPTYLIDQLKRHEGFRSKPYRCTAEKLTIGYGRNLDDNGITRAEATTLLINDIDTVRTLLTNVLPWFEGLDDVRRDALVNMGINLGVYGLLGFKRMLDAMKRGEWYLASREALDSTWATQVGYRAKELSNQIRTGKYWDATI